MGAPPRFPLEFQAILKFSVGEQRLQTTTSTQNMSLRGLCVQIKEGSAPAEGALIEVLLILGDIPEERKVQMTARVVWNKDGRLGLEIRSIQGRGLVLFENLLQGYQTLFNFNPLAFPASRAA